MVGLVEVLLNVVVLIRNPGPNLNLFLDAEDTALSDAEVFVKVVVDGT